MTFQERPTGAAPRTVDGVTFQCWHIGIDHYVWRSPNGLLVVGTNYSKMTYYAIVGVARLTVRFRSLDSAMRGAVREYKQHYFEAVP